MSIWRGVMIGWMTLLPLSAHDIITTKLTFTRDVSRIFVRRCQSCHSAEASIPLMTYEQARPWAVAIKEQVLTRQMPPWGAVKGYGHLSPDNGLTQEEILLIAAWVVGGAPKGDPAFLPAAKVKSPIAGAELTEGIVVDNKVKIEKPIAISGIRPIAKATVESARILVKFPDGHVEPLLWLFHYNPTWRQTFRFRDSLILPAGSIVESGVPLQFALMTKSQSR